MEDNKIKFYAVRDRVNNSIFTDFRKFKTTRGDIVAVPLNRHYTDTMHSPPPPPLRPINREKARAIVVWCNQYEEEILKQTNSPRRYSIVELKR